MDKEAYLKGFDEELEKISGIGQWFKKFSIGKAHQDTSKALQKAMKAAGNKWSKLTPRDQGVFLSTYMGHGDSAAKRSMRKRLLAKI